MLAEEVLDQERHVLLARAQRRDVELNHVQPIVEIAAERAALDLRLEVAVGRRQHAHVELLLGDAADALDLALLQDAQELDLHRRAELADLVEEQRAAVGGGEQPGAIAHRAGERAAHVAEQLALEQRVGDRADVDADERPLVARRQVVQRARHHLLAGARLAGDQHRRLRRGDLAQELEQPLHRRRLADHAIEAEAPLELGPELEVVAHQRALLEGARDHDADLADL